MENSHHQAIRVATFTRWSVPQELQVKLMVQNLLQFHLHLRCNWV